jgi:hypothetical protein
VQVAARELKARGFTVNLTNLGFPAMVLSRRIQDLGTQYGRTIPGNFLDQQAPFVLPTATLVTIFAGANDVDSIVAALGGGAGGTDQVGYINSQIQAFGQDFATLVRTVRERAPGARLVVVNLPNMAGMPRHANASIQQRRAEQMLSVGMTTQVINAQAASGVLVVDMMCDPTELRSLDIFERRVPPERRRLRVDRRGSGGRGDDGLQAAGVGLFADDDRQLNRPTRSALAAAKPTRAAPRSAAPRAWFHREGAHKGTPPSRRRARP